MPLTAELVTAATPGKTATLGTLRTSEVARDFTVLLAVCITVGLGVGLGMMLAVLVLAGGG